MTDKDDRKWSTLVKNNRAGLRSLREDHLDILDSLTSKHGDRNNNCDEKNTPDDNIKERINAVGDSLQLLEVGIADSGLMLSLAEYFDNFEAERGLARLEMQRVKDENDWLRDELENTERRLHEALASLTQLEEEKLQYNFTNEVTFKKLFNSMYKELKVPFNSSTQKVKFKSDCSIFFKDADPGERLGIETCYSIKDTCWTL